MCELERLSMILGKKVTDVKSMVKQFFQIIILLRISGVLIISPFSFEKFK